MKRLVTSVIMMVTIAVPAVAHAGPPTPQHLRQYKSAYRAVRQQFGPHEAGCNLVGKKGSCHIRVSDAAIVKSLGVLERDLTPPSVPVAHIATPVNITTVTTAIHQVATSVSSGTHSVVSGVQNATGSYAVPSYIVQCESGGNWQAVNESSGAGGAYQIMPSTWKAYGGTGLPQNASPAEQSAIAAKIWAGGAGASQWSCAR